MVLPSTDKAADHYFGPVHRTSFERLHRLDGDGWLQAGLWSFTTGRGGATRHHATVFAYGIHVFKGKKGAKRALADVKLKTHAYRVSRLYARIYRASDAHQSLVFLFFTYKEILVESYYEYHGTAPASIAHSLRSTFDRQARDLAVRVKALHRNIHQAPPPTSTLVPTATSSPTVTPVPTEVVTATATTVPTATQTVIPTAVPSPTSAPLVLTAGTDSATYATGSPMTIHVSVSEGGQPLSGASVNVSIAFPGNPGICSLTTDQNGQASCTVTVPASTPAGTHVQIAVWTQAPDGKTAQSTVTVTITGS